jgi:Ala-tRNA(Pro) deacylase
MNVKTFLNSRSVWYDALEHDPTYSAQRMAQALHVPGDEVAKTVLLRADGQYVVAVVPATCNVDLKRAKQALGAKRVELATETEFGEAFPDCEIGAVPPFGSQYGFKTLVDAELARDEQIVFESNSHHEAIRMNYADFVKVEQPQVAAFSVHA